MSDAVQRAAEALRQAERILFITGAGLSADSGLPTYRGVGGLYNGHTEDGLPIEAALSGPMLELNPGLCWKYLAEIGRACLAGKPNAGHLAIAELQNRKPGCWVLTQNVDGYHRAAGSPPQRLIEIHGTLAPLFCMRCGEESAELAEHLSKSLPPQSSRCSGVLRPPVVLFEEMLPALALRRLQSELQTGFDAVVAVGTSASFAYIVEPLLHVRNGGGFTAQIDPSASELSLLVDVHIAAAAADVLPHLIRHIFSD
ncbi:NAD-dependent protein deacylase [Pseudomonas stutzeri]|uniref:protein acetyllysine N-acetyltransferase n=1 Tax=Stutzerimonas stutzeri TaxID=316 RepID=A0A2N8SN53_STUST|nr:NAD-dependent protein deacylase [Stutzerimonas stutzeri]MCQ4250052.1 NAD-dependent protein deacylase [Stutzerimonas stutzeri]PNG03926.1 NAD-dependent protein deacylase [Stutzerimonas stutzeri]